VGEAIKAIYRDMEYAKTLVKRRGKMGGGGSGAAGMGGHDDWEETWTFVGEEGDGDAVGVLGGKRMSSPVATTTAATAGAGGTAERRESLKTKNTSMEREAKGKGKQKA